MERKKIVIGVLSLIIITALAFFFMANQVDNDTWDDTHWGGDVGEEEYNVPRDDDTSDDFWDICNTGICSSVILFVVVVVPPSIKYWKGKK